MAKAESATKVVEWIASAVGIGGGLLGWMGFVVSSRSKKREEERQKDRDKRGDEATLRTERDRYHQSWTDCEEERIDAERKSQELIRSLEAEIDRVTAQLRLKSEEKHDLEAWVRALHAFSTDASDELRTHEIPFRPLPTRHQMEP